MGLSGEDVNISWNDSILDTIRERPAMYVGVKSLTALWFFLKGYEMGRSRLRGFVIPMHFADWVAYRLHLESDWSGFWCRAILSRIRDEQAAVDRFYELRDEFLNRQEKVVATIHDDQRVYRIGRLDADQKIALEEARLPRSLKILIYTDDPGFFLTSDADEPFPDNGRFFPALSAWREDAPERFQIHDELTWRRLLTENARYKRILARRRKRNQQRRPGGRS